METSGYSARQRRAINQVWTACGDYKFEPQFLAMQSDGQPDLYMNCVIGLVHKWFGDELPKQLFAAWAGDARQAVYDDLAWLALENAVYEKELPKRPALAALRQAHASAFFVRHTVRQMENRAWAETACADPLGKGTVGGSCLSRYHEWRGGSGGDPGRLPKISPL